MHGSSKAQSRSFAHDLGSALTEAGADALGKAGAGSGMTSGAEDLRQAAANTSTTKGARTGRS